MMSTAFEIPLFPLRTVLFPGGVLPLRIFEPRYVDMVRRRMRDAGTFGVVLIRSGAEARLAADAHQPDVFEIGTEARIVDFNQADNGLLGIVARGERKIAIHRTYEQADHLMLGEVDYLPAEPDGAVQPEHESLVGVLRELAEHPMVAQLQQHAGAIDFAHASTVSMRLAELLPVEPEIKQALLQLQLPRERLSELRRIVSKFQG